MMVNKKKKRKWSVFLGLSLMHLLVVAIMMLDYLATMMDSLVPRLLRLHQVIPVVLMIPKRLVRKRMRAKLRMGKLYNVMSGKWVKA